MAKISKIFFLCGRRKHRDERVSQHGPEGPSSLVPNSEERLRLIKCILRYKTESGLIRKETSVRFVTFSIVYFEA